MDKYFDDLAKGRFEYVKNEVAISVIKKSYKSLIRMAYQTEDPQVLRFVQYLDEHYPNDHELKYIVAEMLVTAFNYLPGGYKLAFEYAKSAIRLNENNTRYKEFILLFYTLPGKLLNRKDALKYAREILKVDPTNKAAELVFKLNPLR